MKLAINNLIFIASFFIYSYLIDKSILFNMKNFGNIFLTFCIILFAIFLLFFSSSNILAVQSSINLCLNSIFPSLFPFLVVSELLSYTSIINLLSAKFERIMRCFFKMPGISAFPFIIGMISGYPVGAKIISNLREKGKISAKDANLLLIFTNNAGPLFIIGSIGCSIYLNSTIGFLLLGVNILASIITGFVFTHFFKVDYRIDPSIISDESSLRFSSLGEILSDCIKKAFNTLSIVCGFIIVFSIIISMIQTSKILSIFNNQWVEYTVLGILEITTGIKLISSIPGTSLFLHLIITSFLIGTGGLSVLLQVWSIISKTDLSIKPYLYGKIFSGICAASLMFFILKVFPILQFSI